MYVYDSQRKFEWDIVGIALRCVWAQFSIVKLQTETCWFGTLPPDLQMVRWTRPSVKLYVFPNPSMAQKLNKLSFAQALAASKASCSFMAYGSASFKCISNTSRSSPANTCGTYCHISISWCLFLWLRMSPPGDAMCKVLHHLAVAAPLLCASGVCKSILLTLLHLSN